MLRTYQPNTRKAKKDHGFFARKEAGTGVQLLVCTATGRGFPGPFHYI